MTKKPERPVSENAPGEFPVLGFEPFIVPEGVTLADLLERLDKLEAEVSALKAKAKA